MILICSSDEKLVTRWRKGMPPSSVLAAVADLSSLQQAIQRPEATLAVVDLALPGLGEAEAKHLCAAAPSVAFFFLSERPNGQEGVALIGAGARGYGNRYMAPELLRQAIEVIELGEVWLGRNLTEHLIKKIAQKDKVVEQPEVDDRFSQLTQREREIALKVAEGDSNKVIARALNITERTVKAHLSAVFRKTGVRDRLQLALLVRQSGARQLAEN
jgi:DNA-binding NarL/FixJ family response regulator